MSKNHIILSNRERKYLFSLNEYWNFVEHRNLRIFGAFGRINQIEAFIDEKCM
ncbi:22519_t:CDS:2 [Entrophospora sp. SA101]|nr:22519_t:CDS:2 [Entrophospora sp. SA101]